MALNITPVENHRQREKGVLVYPVYSRRAQGLSIGINLYPAKKSCPFDCPYCEVFPFSNRTEFSLNQMEDDLRECIKNAQEQNIEIKDICFSGNGEPTLSHDFPKALELAQNIHKELCASSTLVVISNGAGLLNDNIFSVLKNAAKNPLFDIWLKLDAGTKEWFDKINKTNVPYDKLISKIKEFVLDSPATIQTMLCAIDDNPPPPQEEQAWKELVQELAVKGNLRKVQIYGKARPAPQDPKSSALPALYLQERAAALNINVPVEVY